jgi:hypothetical protein
VLNCKGSRLGVLVIRANLCYKSVTHSVRQSVAVLQRCHTQRPTVSGSVTRGYTHWHGRDLVEELQSIGVLGIRVEGHTVVHKLRLQTARTRVTKVSHTMLERQWQCYKRVTHNVGKEVAAFQKGRKAERQWQ